MGGWVARRVGGSGVKNVETIFFVGWEGRGGAAERTGVWACFQAAKEPLGKLHRQYRPSTRLAALVVPLALVVIVSHIM